MALWEQKTMSFQVHCKLCSGNFIFEEEPTDFICICRNKPKPWSILHHCSNGHTTWLKNMNADCDICSKEKTIKTAKKLLSIQSNPKRDEIEQSIVSTNRIFHNKQLEFFKRKKLADDSIIELPNLLKDMIKTVKSMKKDNENSKKLDYLESRLKDMESKLE